MPILIYLLTMIKNVNLQNNLKKKVNFKKIGRYKHSFPLSVAFYSISPGSGTIQFHNPIWRAIVGSRKLSIYDTFRTKSSESTNRRAFPLRSLPHPREIYPAV